ncbi:hypothetical protein CAPTEDRAFT_203466 [Capitella teleta]|uniref:Phospholipid-transporting ATPase n=1 Tax=Capitella teleta TaxID=283909 RepID=R7VCU0_CAPTE|nr:hypothetical protein CAPTEDRAFT_203466 [Capitella teleta]|eukprot:ELU14116.1 hypothetical protein CAPTEDRAFT_203466 [Capitella teleta]
MDSVHMSNCVYIGCDMDLHWLDVVTMPCFADPLPEKRTVYVDNKYPPGVEVEVPVKYPSNRIISSRYTAWNIIPKNLFEQFHRIANFYFLCVAFVELLIDSPVSPWTSIVPLIFVVVVTFGKQAYEDWLRHKSDREVNDRPAVVVREGQEVKVTASDIHVGDVVRVVANEEIPCDMVMLSSEDPEGGCYITTANLDGETNLKTFTCVSNTKFLQTESFQSFRASIECEQPTTDLYKFVVIVKPLSADNLLLRGSRLKNTQYVFGCAVYTGQDTKISQNSKFKSHKYSRVEKKMNTFLLIFLGALALYSAIWVGLKFAFYEDEAHSEEKMWYVEAEPEMSALVAIEEFLAFMILCNYVIPISMYVTVELQKFFGSMFFGWDVEMYDAQLNEPAKANTSDLNEELGQVEYLFSDKTGTLTENLMEFRLCSVKSVKYIEVGGVLCHQPDDDVSHFLRVLALCHSLHVDKPADFTCGTYSDTGREYDYQASSPDEKALVEACRRYGVIYHGTRDEAREVSFHGDMKRYQLHHTLEFDPVRKRMSVIIQDEDDRYWLLCKGAETSVLERISEGDVVTVETHINDFAVLGLRTLVIAQRELTSAEFKEFDTMLHAARKSLENREGKLQTVYDQVERKMTLLGATAVEDRLQDGVPETISALREAGIQVWVLTGDKEETAVNISYSAGHFNHSMEPISVTKQNIQEHVNTGASKKHALVIDGMSIAFALQDHADLLRDLCEGCVTVLCCRMSPIQKARVVKLMKESKNDPTTAAIGDGANDVSMIQEAHIGLGIMGKEGRQAVRASDYAFGRFKFVRRALLVHGHYFYVRMAMLVQYFFFKNVAMIMAQLYFTFYSAYSAQTIFESYFLTVYNVTFTTLPILIYGIFEISVSSEILLKYPSLYL